jgi:1-aminocyclopropane-1-carboxylate deaminase
MHPKLIELEQCFGTSVLIKINDSFLENHQVSLWIKRDDLLHPVISGNKWRKLKYNLNEALSLNKDTIISMGGAYSNHLHALAFAGKSIGLKTVGIIRGDRPSVLTPTLQDMEDWGMTLRFISRSEFREYRYYKSQDDLPEIQANQYWLPEGGANKLALKGIGELVGEINTPYDTLCVACGTGATLTGLINSVSGQVSVLGFAALKNAHFLKSDVQSLLSKECNNWEIIHDYHFGGFAKQTTNLTVFMQEFEQKTLIPLDPVYTGKMLFGLYDLIANGYFKPGQRIIAVHTGGLQGLRGYA